MAFVNIDAPGNRANRRGVNAIQRSHGKEGRLLAAQQRRDRRAARRAGGPNVVLLYPMPSDGLSQSLHDGAYVREGGEDTGGQYQIAIAGPLVAPVEAYCAALSRWMGKPFRVILDEPMLRPKNDIHPGRPYTNIILEPAP